MLELSGELALSTCLVVKKISISRFPIGIGNQAILEPLGIETLIDLPGVGENLQVHGPDSTLAMPY